MKKIWLMGGFGNVLFQILAFEVIKSQTNHEVFFVEVLTEKNIITRILKWSIHQKLYQKLISKQQIKNVNLVKSFCVISLAFFSKITNRNYKYSTFYINNVEFEYSNLSDNIFGYFQEKKFLSENQQIILSLGERLNSIFHENLSYDIVVHYRGGDSGWALLYNDYYKKVKDLLILEPGRSICVVTDSLDNANSFFGNIDNLKIINSKNAIDDFKIMISTNYKLYCAPSTFSWWAAHSLNKDKQIIAPSFLQEKLGMFVKGNLTLINI